MHEVNGSTLYLMDGLTVLKETKTVLFFIFQNFHMVVKLASLTCFNSSLYKFEAFQKSASPIQFSLIPGHK